MGMKFLKKVGDAPVIFLVILRPAVVEERFRFIVAVPATCVPASTVIVTLSLRSILSLVRVLAAGLQRPLRCAHLVRCASELGSWRVGMLPHRVVEVARVVAVLRVSSWNHVRTLFWIPLLKGRQFIRIQIYTECNWNVWTDFGPEFHIPKQEEMSISTGVRKHLIWELHLKARTFCHVGFQITTSETSPYIHNYWVFGLCPSSGF
jgi:hypothetical protein